MLSPTKGKRLDWPDCRRRITAAGAPLLPVVVTTNAPPNVYPHSVNIGLPATASAKAVVSDGHLGVSLDSCAVFHLCVGSAVSFLLLFSFTSCSYIPRMTVLH